MCVVVWQTEAIESCCNFSTSGGFVNNSVTANLAPLRFCEYFAYKYFIIIGKCLQLLQLYLFQIGFGEVVVSSSSDSSGTNKLCKSSADDCGSGTSSEGNVSSLGLKNLFFITFMIFLVP